VTAVRALPTYTHRRTSTISFFFSASPVAGAGSERVAVLATCIHDTHIMQTMVHFSCGKRRRYHMRQTRSTYPKHIHDKERA